jgi:hypothetical protein
VPAPLQAQLALLQTRRAQHATLSVPLPLAGMAMRMCTWWLPRHHYHDAAATPHGYGYGTAAAALLAAHGYRGTTTTPRLPRLRCSQRALLTRSRTAPSTHMLQRARAQ